MRSKAALGHPRGVALRCVGVKNDGAFILNLEKCPTFLRDRRHHDVRIPNSIFD